MRVCERESAASAWQLALSFKQWKKERHRATKTTTNAKSIVTESEWEQEYISKRKVPGRTDQNRKINSKCAGAKNRE